MKKNTGLILPKSETTWCKIVFIPIYYVAFSSWEFYYIFYLFDILKINLLFMKNLIIIYANWYKKSQHLWFVVNLFQFLKLGKNIPI